ncbi:DUF3300 domain-containing protein [Luteibacter aegosomaticola]|uniref:DUF3300 domain-containing protein n=1 Tax=Luteibacter aegosomaticola TaxID=2911538 RepID=UPI001FF8F3FD|nr:DUF3300 domain-containing protein [Luteibacter aegosomaticola]UPG91348.1 DUF3300 domain-containing protein [Luteibacter aegosomaticola]
MDTRRTGAWLRHVAAWLLALAATSLAAQGAAPAGKTFTKEQVDQYMAPIALYPDALLSQILMAATYPADVADAAAWSKQNPKATGDAAVKQVSSKPWDPSVQSLVAFPQVLAQMGAHPDWVRNIGDAFLAQPDDVMASAQRLRAQAQKAGNLKSNAQQKVVVQETAPQTTVIQIEPADPQVVYVPAYNPTVVYGTWAYPAYPPPAWPPPPGYQYPVATGLAAGLAFGTGVAIANSLWGGFDWGHNDVNINVNRYNNINVNNHISGNGNVNWNHNPANRRGTPYRDPATQARFNQGIGGAQQRQAFRGQDPAREASRQQALQSFNRSTGGGASPALQRGSAGNANTPGNRANAGNFANRTEQRPGANASGAQRPGANGGGVQRQPLGNGNEARANAFSGVRSPGDAGAARQRGESSLQQRGGGNRPNVGAAHPVNRPVPMHAGGFHRR